MSDQDRSATSRFLERAGLWIANRISGPYNMVASILGLLRATFFTSLFMSLALAVPDPTREVFLQMALGVQSGDERMIIGFCASVALLALLCFNLWYAGRWLIYRMFLVIEEDLASPSDRSSARLLNFAGSRPLKFRESWRVFLCEDPNASDCSVALMSLDGDDRPVRIAKWAPRIIGILPAAAAALGLLMTSTAPEAEGARLSLYLGAAIAVVVAVLVLFITWKRYEVYTAVTGSGVSRLQFRTFGAHKARELAKSWVLWAWLAFFLLIVVIRVDLPQLLGPVAIACFFGTALATCTTYLSYIHERFAVPAISILFGLAVLFSLLDWTDNHRVEMAATKAPARQLNATGAFEQWYSARREKWIAAHGEDTPYPVHIVATQGGALYAAYHTAAFLARMEENGEAPNDYSQHLFAISGVSGGSVGAAIYTGIRKSRICAEGEDNCYIDAVRQVLRNDFLSPALAAMGTTDFTARFLPTGAWLSPRDRARALQAGFDAEFRDWSGQDHDSSSLRLGVLGYWDAKGKAPALLLNATDVTTGERMVLSPFHEISSSVRSYSQTALCQHQSCDDPTILSSGIISARFPLVSPAATIDFDAARCEALKGVSSVTPCPAKARFVDGGYFENSGVETALDLIDAIQNSKYKDNVQVRLIVLDFPSRVSDKRGDRSYGLGETLSPVKGLLGTRNARTDLAKDRAFFGARENDNLTVFSMSLDNDSAQFTLNWMLAKTTFDQIECDMRFLDACDKKREISNEQVCNDFVLERLRNDLSGDVMLDQVEAAKLRRCVRGRI